MARWEDSSTGSQGRIASSSGSCRETPIVHSAVRRLPCTRVSQAEGICTSWAANGSAPRTPTSTGVRPRYRAQAVIAPPLAQAPTSSATTPSATDILLVLWVLGLVSGAQIGAWVHILLILAVISLIFAVLRRGTGAAVP